MRKIAILSGIGLLQYLFFVLILKVFEIFNATNLPSVAMILYLTLLAGVSKGWFIKLNMFCPKCGVKNLDTSKFCKNCGRNLSDYARVLQQIQQVQCSAQPQTALDLAGDDIHHATLIYDSSAEIPVESSQNEISEEMIKVFEEAEKRLDEILSDTTPVIQEAEGEPINKPFYTLFN